MPRSVNGDYRQRPADTVTILFLVFLLLLTGSFYRVLQKGPFLVGLYSMLIVVQILLARYRGNGRMFALSHDLIFPVICVLLIFDSLEWVVHSINPQDIDPLLIRLDYLIFGDHPTVKRVDVVAACTKIGHTLLLDRVTGQPIFPFRLRRAPTSDLRGEAAPGALWGAVIFAGVLGLNRSFLAERDNECLQGLLLCPVDRGTIYLAKVVANFLFMLAAQVVIVPVFVFFFNVPASLGLVGVFLTIAIGLLGFSAVGTLFAAIAVRTRAREVMLPLLLLPLVVPLFIAGFNS